MRNVNETIRLSVHQRFVCIAIVDGSAVLVDLIHYERVLRQEAIARAERVRTYLCGEVVCSDSAINDLRPVAGCRRSYERRVLEERRTCNDLLHTGIVTISGLCEDGEIDVVFASNTS